MPKILFLPEGTSLEVRDGITIQEAGRNAGLLLDAPCGGHGICKKCKVRIRREENEEPQDVLSCQYRVHEDLIVEHFEGEDKAAILTEGKKALFYVQPVKNVAFGTYMNPKSASRIGLIPETLLAKVEAGGNGAGMGACMLAMDGKLFMKTDEIVSKIQPLELSSIPIFQRTFAQEMTFKMN